VTTQPVVSELMIGSAFKGSANSKVSEKPGVA
jgi:hypothetical protein